MKGEKNVNTTVGVDNTLEDIGDETFSMFFLPRTIEEINM